MHKHAIGILLSLIFVGGCVKIPTEEASCHLASIPKLNQTTEKALEDNHFYEGEFPDTHWWEMFNDPQLSQLICQALSCNPLMNKVEARVKAAEAEAKIKRSRLFPTIGFNADLDWQYLGKNSFFRAFTPVFPGNITEYEIDLDFSYELDFWGKNRNIYRSALGIARAEAAERESAILMLSTSVAAIYFKLQATMQQLALLKEERKLLTHLVTLTNLRKKHALDNSSQQLQAQEKIFAINKNIYFKKKKIVLHKNMLHMLIGEGPDAFEPIDSISLKDPIKFPLPENISSDLLARRPDLKAHIWRVEAAAHLVGAARADFYPRVDLCALAGLDSVFVQKLFGWNSRTYSVKPALHLPIFTAGRIKANLRARQAEFEELIYAYNETVLRAVKEVANQITTLQTTNETLNEQQLLVQNKIANRQLTALRYQHALSTLLDVLQMQDEVIQEKFKKIRLQYNQRIAAIELIKVLGGGYCNEEDPFG